MGVFVFVCGAFVVCVLCVLRDVVCLSVVFCLVCVVSGWCVLFD